MDEAKRAQLYARREALLAEKARQAHISARADYVARVPILAALEAAGDPYDSGGYGDLTGPLNHWAWDEHAYPIEQLGWAELASDADARAAAVLAMVRERVAPEAIVTVVLGWERLVLRLPMSVLARHVATLLESGEGDTLGFAAPPEDWILVVYQYGAERRHAVVTGRLVDRLTKRSASD